MKRTTLLHYYIATLLLFSIFFRSHIVFAAEKTNKFGIHIAEVSDVKDAAALVNGNDGDWGFVTIVIKIDDLHKDKWQKFMNDCRRLHLTPILRLAAKAGNDSWEKPKEEDGKIWADFLGGLIWPIKQRYVIAYNEPNQPKEWGNAPSPKEYARVLSSLIDALKEKSPDFFILPAGFDLAHPNNAYYFWREMNWEVPAIFTKIDGWASHSYPNHGYRGTPYDFGRASVRGYLWELGVLEKEFGVKGLPVFITETGWPFESSRLPGLAEAKPRAGKVQGSRFYDEKTAAEFTKIAFENIWLPDEKVFAVTPFILNYPQEPFEEFSWKNKEGSPSAVYSIVESMPKVSWEPLQEQNWSLESMDLPEKLFAGEIYPGRIILKNLGQNIWGEKIPFILVPQKDNGLFASGLYLPTGKKVEPGETASFDIILSASESGNYKFSFKKLPEQEVTFLPKEKPLFGENEKVSEKPPSKLSELSDLLLALKNFIIGVVRWPS